MLESLFLYTNVYTTFLRTVSYFVFKNSMSNQGIVSNPFTKFYWH